MFCLMSDGEAHGMKMRIMVVKTERILQNENSDVKLE